MIALLVSLSLIETVQGDLPIILASPHGGTTEIPGGVRTGNGAKQFVVVTDTRTDDLARATAEEVERLFGKKPWVVIAQFSRKFVDVNRPIESGAESDPAREQYKAYHEAVKKAVEAVRTKFGHGLLIDIHGQGAEKDTVFRGTQNLKTVAGLSDDSLFGPSSFLGLLDASGIKIFPTMKNAHDPENPKFDGGYTVQTYGKDGIAAIQLEFGASYRTTKAIPYTAKKLAEALHQAKL
ncbi:MAG: N-formylglutamate amidohydrolase [Armatimonadetes bacterium]|nr:N-formylglutamate amidohydrolase [Armatimonadota bacterium]